MSRDDDGLPEDPVALQALVKALKASLAEKDQVLAEKDQVLAEKDQVLAEKDQVLAERDQVLAERDQVLAEKDQVLAEKLDILRAVEERDARMRERIAWLQRKLFGKSSEKVHLDDFDEILEKLGILFGFETGDSRDEEEGDASGEGVGNTEAPAGSPSSGAGPSE